MIFQRFWKTRLVLIIVLYSNLVLNRLKNDPIEGNLEITSIEGSILNNDSIKDTLDLEFEKYLKNKNENKSKMN